MKYRVVVDSTMDWCGEKKVEPYKEFDTLKEARAMVRNFYRDRHFNCYNNYYIQHFKNGKWTYLDKRINEREKEENKPITISEINWCDDIIKLPIKVHLTKLEANNGKLVLFVIIKELVKAFPREDK